MILVKTKSWWSNAIAEKSQQLWRKVALFGNFWRQLKILVLLLPKSAFAQEDTNGFSSVVNSDVSTSCMVDIADKDGGIANIQLGWDGFLIKRASRRTPQMAFWDDDCGSVFFGRFC